MSALALQLIEKEKQAKTGRLDLGACGLFWLPEQLFELVWLEELNLVDRYWDYERNPRFINRNKGKANEIESLSAEISQLKKLKSLRLNLVEWGSVEELSYLSQLTDLEELELSESNCIKDISFLSSLGNLRFYKS